MKSKEIKASDAIKYLDEASSKLMYINWIYDFYEDNTFLFDGDVEFAFRSLKKLHNDLSVVKEKLEKVLDETVVEL